jgi:hypothetical protein
MRPLSAILISILLSGCAGGNFYIRTNIPALAEAGRQAQLEMIKKAKCPAGSKVVIETTAGVTSNGRYTPSESASINWRCVSIVNPK